MQFSMKFVPMGPIDNKSSLVDVMAWHWTGDKPFPEPVTTHLDDASSCLQWPLLLTWFNFNPSMDQ